MALPPLEIRVTADTSDAEVGFRDVERAQTALATATQNYQSRLRSLASAQKTGVVSGRNYANAINEIEREYEQAAIAAGRMANANVTVGRSTTKYGRNAQAAAGNTANLAAQFNDIGVMLAAGQSPLLLAVQQGTQVNQVLGQMGGTGASRVRALGTALMSIVSPANLMTLGIIAGGAALVQWAIKASSANDEAEELGATLDEVREKTRELNIELRRMRLGITAEELALVDAIQRSQSRIRDIQEEMVDLNGRNLRAAQLRLDAERGNLSTLQGQLNTLQDQLRTREQLNNMARPRMRPMDLGAKVPTRPQMRPMDLGAPAPAGGGGGGGGTDPRASRLQTFIDSLQTEREVLEEWRVEQLELLSEFTDKELEAIGGKNEAKLRLEEEYQDRLNQIQRAGKDVYLNTLQSTLGSVAQILESGGEKSLKIAKAFGVAEALISTWRGAAKALELPYPKNIAAFAHVLATGFGAVNAIKGVSKGGGGGENASGSAPQPVVNTQRVDINIVGGNDRDRVVAKEVISALNNAQRDGFRLDPRLIGAG